MKAIVATDVLWNIGNNGDLLFRIKEDMKFFKEQTTGKVVVMGRKTFESLPNGKPLKDRINLVITSKEFDNYDNVVFGTLDEIREEIAKYNSDDVYIIGGANVYKEFIHECDSIYITRVSSQFKADTSIPNISFEGFSLAKFINSNEADLPDRKVDWVMSEWHNKPYKAVVWINDYGKGITCAYSDDLDKWKSIFSNTELVWLRKIIRNRMISKLQLNRLIKIRKIRDHYRAEVHIQTKDRDFRMAAFADTEYDAWLNLVKATINV